MACASHKKNHTPKRPRPPQPSPAHPCMWESQRPQPGDPEQPMPRARLSPLSVPGRGSPAQAAPGGLQILTFPRHHPLRVPFGQHPRVPIEAGLLHLREREREHSHETPPVTCPSSWSKNQKFENTVLARVQVGERYYHHGWQRDLVQPRRRASWQQHRPPHSPAFPVRTLGAGQAPLPPLVFETRGEVTRVTPGPGRKSPRGLPVFLFPGVVTAEAACYRWGVAVSQ